jgi:hypothetical protein
VDDVETRLAAKRMTRWPKEWQDTIAALPPQELEVLAELVALLDARPDEGEAERETV